MNKTLSRLCTSLVLMSLMSVFVFASGFSWYFKPSADGKRPELCPEADFVKNYNTVTIGNEGEKKIYLTFDAGYENGNVEKIVDVLRSEGVPAAFFVLENFITQNKPLVKRMIEEGHLVCNHTSKHLDVTKCKSIDEFRGELERLESVYRDATGMEMPKYFRPPEGKFSRQSMEFASKLGYKTIFWSFAYADWDNGKQMCKEKAIDKIMSTLHNGEVMLLHPTSSTNAEILKTLVVELKKQGFVFGTVDEITS